MSKELIDAAAKGDNETVRRLINTPGIDVDYCDEKGQTSLSLAFASNNTDLVLFLLGAGANTYFLKIQNVSLACCEALTLIQNLKGNSQAFHSGVILAEQSDRKDGADRKDKVEVKMGADNIVALKNLVEKAIEKLNGLEKDKLYFLYAEILLVLNADDRDPSLAFKYLNKISNQDMALYKAAFKRRAAILLQEKDILFESALEAADLTEIDIHLKKLNVKDKDKDKDNRRCELLLMREIFTGEIVDINGVAVKEHIARWINRNIPDGAEITALQQLRGAEVYKLISHVKVLLPQYSEIQRTRRLPIESTKAENSGKLIEIAQQRATLQQKNDKLRAQILAARQKLAQKEFDCASQTLQRQQEEERLAKERKQAEEKRAKEQLATAYQLAGLKKMHQILTASAERIKAEIQQIQQKIAEVSKSAEEGAKKIDTLSSQEKQNEQIMNELMQKNQALQQEKSRLEKMIAEARQKQLQDSENMVLLAQSFEQLQKTFSEARLALALPAGMGSSGDGPVGGAGVSVVVGKGAKNIS